MDPLEWERGCLRKAHPLSCCFPHWSDQVRDRRSEADVQVTTDVRSAYAGRTQSVRRTGCPAGTPTTRLVFPFNSGCLVDFLECLAGLAVSSVSPDSRIVRESPPVSIHAETPSNGSLRKSESHRQSHSKRRPHQMSQTGGWVRSSV